MSKFKLTIDWLHRLYGSHTQQEEVDTRKWLLQYGKDVTPDVLEPWSKWRHLCEYQVNTPDIVAQALAMVGREFDSELEVHRLLNLMRVPGAAIAYEKAIKDMGSIPKSKILELGVGGDSAISTSVFLYHLSQQENPTLFSIDRNPLSMTWERYKDVPFWVFRQADSLEVLNELVAQGERFDIIFIDTIHSYTHTKNEMDLACQLTDYMLLDDADFPGNSFDPEPGGVKRAKEVFLTENKGWKFKPYNGESVGMVSKKAVRKSIVKPDKSKTPKQSERKRSTK